ncbi:MAG: tyrosine-type recombinase/integrase [Rhizomicrobium sp.]
MESLEKGADFANPVRETHPALAVLASRAVAIAILLPSTAIPALAQTSGGTGGNGTAGTGGTSSTTGTGGTGGSTSNGGGAGATGGAHGAVVTSTASNSASVAGGRGGEGFPVWTEDDVDRYQAGWPVGTKERVWLDVLLYMGLRRGGAVTLGRQHVRNGIVTLRTEKSQGTMTVTLPILPILATTLAAGPCADLAFICGANGKPLQKESFGNLFREACNKAGVFWKSAHGLRKAGATRAADNGATVTELEAIFGWQGGGMAALYTRAADRKRASIRAMSMMERATDGHSMCQPTDKVGTPELKIE